MKSREDQTFRHTFLHLVRRKKPKDHQCHNQETGMENCVSKEKFISAEGCTGPPAQQEQGTGNRYSFLFLMQWALPLYLDWLSSVPQSVHDWLILHLEFGGGVDSNFSMKMKLSEQESRTASS
jgi:hypothetical protein